MMEYRRSIYAPVEVLSLLSDPVVGLCLGITVPILVYNHWTVPSAVNYEGGGRRFHVRVLYLYVRFSAEEAMSMQEVPDWSFLTSEDKACHAHQESCYYLTVTWLCF